MLNNCPSLEALFDFGLKVSRSSYPYTEPGFELAIRRLYGREELQQQTERLKEFVAVVVLLDCQIAQKRVITNFRKCEDFSGFLSTDLQHQLTAWGDGYLTICGTVLAMTVFSP